MPLHAHYELISSILFILTLSFLTSFLLFAKRAEEKYGVSARDILVELGKRGTVGGQEDMIEDLALTMSRQKNQS